MALDINKIPAGVLENLRERGHSDAAIARMSAEQALSEFCEWEGLIGYGRSLYRHAIALSKAEEA